MKQLGYEDRYRSLGAWIGLRHHSVVYLNIARMYAHSDTNAKSSIKICLEFALILASALGLYLSPREALSS